MEHPDQALIDLYDQLSDEALWDRASGGGLTPHAQAIANAQLQARGITPPALKMPHDSLFNAFDPDAASQTAPYAGDWQIVARQLSPTEAHMLCACLESAGIPAIVADTHFVQAYQLMAAAVGGATVRVPANHVEEAQSVLAAFERGDYALDDNFDPPPEAETP